METKVCSKCSVDKPLSEYHKRSNRPCGVRSQCKECYKKYPSKLKRRENYSREYDLMRTYGLTIEDYNNLSDTQLGVCGICGNTQNEGSKKKNLCVDHCHTTGQIRGLLCDSCNRAIGLLKDDIELLKNAISYLEKHKSSKNNNNKYVKFFEYI